jgi:hypothetical protein
VTAVVCIAVVAAQGEESELIQNQVERAQLHEQLSHLIEDGTAIFNSWDAKDPLDIKEVAEPAKELAMEEKREQEVMVEEPVIYHTTEESKVSELAHDEEQKGSFGTSLDIRNFAKDLAPKAFAHKAPVTDYDAIFSHAKVLPQSIETSATTKQKVFHPRRLERHVKKATKEKAAAKVRKAARRARRAKRHAARIAEMKKQARTNKILHQLLGTDEPSKEVRSLELPGWEKKQAAKRKARRAAKIAKRKAQVAAHEAKVAAAKAAKLAALKEANQAKRMAAVRAEKMRRMMETPPTKAELQHARQEEAAARDTWGLGHVHRPLPLGPKDKALQAKNAQLAALKRIQLANKAEHVHHSASHSRLAERVAQVAMRMALPKGTSMAAKTKNAVNELRMKATSRGRIAPGHKDVQHPPPRPHVPSPEEEDLANKAAKKVALLAEFKRTHDAWGKPLPKKAPKAMKIEPLTRASVHAAVLMNPLFKEARESGDLDKLAPKDEEIEEVNEDLNLDDVRPTSGVLSAAGLQKHDMNFDANDAPLDLETVQINTDTSDLDQFADENIEDDGSFLL